MSKIDPSVAGAVLFLAEEYPQEVLLNAFLKMHPLSANTIALYALILDGVKAGDIIRDKRRYGFAAMEDQYIRILHSRTKGKMIKAGLLKAEQEE